ncbi:YtxH domain-containing protein [Chondrinema litorale]|uniref:YtxH domain-containing protein n=1 Tax=Chondrinema litorale TaxID=2994555 RepID=UPI0025428995|nr:YtxH domain-containing protein [Chondrinema litorale]UZR95137.1 YtxH domain-containing protein [Chondrinema litorale]
MNNNAKILLAALAGASLGAIAGLLVAPGSGKETLDDISKKADELKGELEDMATKSTKSVKELGDAISENIRKSMNGLKKELSDETKS